MKRIVDGFLLALGLALVATGGWWMWTGWDVVQLERGWVAVIAGSVMMTGGVVLVAILWAVVRLQPAERAFAETQAPTYDLPSEPSFAPPSPEAPPRAPAYAEAALGGAAVVVGAATMLGKRAEEPEPAASVEADLEPVMEPDSQPAIESGWPTGESPKAPSTNRLSISNLLRRTAPEPLKPPVAPPLPEPAFGHVAHDEEPDAGVHTDDLDDFDEDDETDATPEGESGSNRLPPAGPIFPRAPELEEKPAPSADAPRVEPQAPAHEEGDWFDQAERSLERTRQSVDLDSMGESAPQPVAPHKSPMVTGRYSSGDTNYIMYDDGSIEAQTPEGVMRFDSLVELRRFVEQRK